MPAPNLEAINAAVRDSEWARLKTEARELVNTQRQGQVLDLAPGKLLLPYQAELFTKLQQHDVLVVEKGRRTGFTWGVAAKASLAAAASRTARGMNVFYIGYNREMAREFIDVAAMWAKAFAQAVVNIDHEYVFEYEDERGEKHAIKAFRVEFASGYYIVALPSKPRSLRGMQGLVIIDEAAFHDDLEEVMKAALALLMWGGIVVVISTHNGKDNYFNTLVEEARTGKKDYGYMRVDFGRAITEGLYQRICLVTGKPWNTDAELRWKVSIESKYGGGADEELYCIPRADSSVDIFIPRSLVDAAIARELPEINGQSVVLGCDVARFGDDSSIIWPRKGRDARSLPILTYKGLSTIDFAQKIIEALMRYNALLAFVDETGVGGGVVDALGMFGCDRFMGVMFSAGATDRKYANKRAEMYGGLRDWMPTGCLPGDNDVAREISAVKYSYQRDSILLESKDELKKRLGYSPDRPDALALTFAAPVAPVDPMEELREAVRGPYNPRATGGSYDPRAL